MKPKTKNWEEEFDELLDNSNVSKTCYECSNTLSEPNRLEIKSFIRNLIQETRKEVIKKCLPVKKDSWGYGGGGGIDTDYWCKKGVCFSIPGIKQIVSYGIKNDNWWTKYFLKWQEILPEKYKAEGFNCCIEEIIFNLEKKFGIKL